MTTDIDRDPQDELEEALFVVFAGFRSGRFLAASFAAAFLLTAVIWISLGMG